MFFFKEITVDNGKQAPNLIETRRYFLVNSNNVFIHLFLTGPSALVAHILEMTSPPLCYGRTHVRAICNENLKCAVPKSKRARTRRPETSLLRHVCKKKTCQWTPRAHYSIM